MDLKHLKLMLEYLFKLFFKDISKSSYKMYHFIQMKSWKKLAGKNTRRSLILDALYYKTQEKPLDENTRRVLYWSVYGKWQIKSRIEIVSEYLYFSI